MRGSLKGSTTWLSGSIVGGSQPARHTHNHIHQRIQPDSEANWKSNSHANAFYVYIIRGSELANCSVHAVVIQIPCFTPTRNKSDLTNGTGQVQDISSSEQRARSTKCTKLARKPRPSTQLLTLTLYLCIPAHQSCVLAGHGHLPRRA